MEMTVKITDAELIKEICAFQEKEGIASFEEAVCKLLKGQLESPEFRWGSF